MDMAEVGDERSTSKKYGPGWEMSVFAQKDLVELGHKQLPVRSE